MRKEILRSSPKKKGQPTGGIEPPTFRLQSECSTTKLSRRTTLKMHHVFLHVKRLRGPGIEPGSTAWKATMLTITPATPDNGRWALYSTQTCTEAKMFCILRGSNSRGLCPLGLKSSALTTRPRMRVRNTHSTNERPQKGCCSQSETRTHNLPVNSRARCRLRHPGTFMMETELSISKNVPPAGIEPATNRLKVERST